MLVPKTATRFVLGYKPISDRIMTVKIKSSPFNLNVVQVYAPTTEATEEDIDNFYTQLESTIKDLPRREIVSSGGLKRKDWKHSR